MPSACGTAGALISEAYGIPGTTTGDFRLLDTP
jgi:hypothetical protein